MNYSVMVAQEILVLSVKVRTLVVQQNFNYMGKTTGYKGMLRDRVPKVVNYALKWQKAKERWINHTYSNFINVYVDKEERKKATRLVLCLKYTHVKQGKRKYIKEEQNFDFDKSIDWDNLTPEEEVYWKRISSWVRWFRKKYAYIENTYQISRDSNKDEMSIKIDIINGYLTALLPSQDMDEETKQAKYKYVDNLVDFLIKCFEERV